MAVQLTIQGNWFRTRVYNRECMPLPAPGRVSLMPSIINQNTFGVQEDMCVALLLQHNLLEAAFDQAASSAVQASMQLLLAVSGAVERGQRCGTLDHRVCCALCDSCVW